MDDNKFWINIWLIFFGFTATLALIIGGCEIHRDSIIQEEIKAGVDPMKALCAHDRGTERYCMGVAK